MLKHIVILGGGHAGSSAALAAAKRLTDLSKTDAIKITLINQSPYLTIRPRLYEYELEQARVLLEAFLAPVGVDVIVATVTKLDLSQQRIGLDTSQDKQTLRYDALVL